MTTTAELESMKRMFVAACTDLGLINEALGLDPNDGGAAPILAAISALKNEAAKSERRAQAFGEVLSNSIIAMQAATIDAQLISHTAGMVWIFNTLRGAGHLPDLDAAIAMGGAQAWFDAKTEEEEARVEALRAAA